VVAAGIRWPAVGPELDVLGCRLVRPQLGMNPALGRVDLEALVVDLVEGLALRQDADAGLVPDVRVCASASAGLLPFLSIFFAVSYAPQLVPAAPTGRNIAV